MSLHHQARSAVEARRWRFDAPQRLVGHDGQQRRHDRAGHDLLAEVLGDALEDDVAKPAGAKYRPRWSPTEIWVTTVIRMPATTTGMASGSSIRSSRRPAP